MNQSHFPFDRDREKDERDEALRRVRDNAGLSWQVQATNLLMRQQAGLELTGEDLRMACLDVEIVPHHHNAWGGLISALVREGILVPTGRYRKMRAPGSHARETKIYRLNGQRISGA